jgi:hypothetical protein
MILLLSILGRTTAPTGTTVYTSAAGLVSDADLSMHSTTYGTDNTTAMQTLLDMGGSASNPLTIYVDGTYSATQLKVKSYTTIICTDNTKGFIQRPTIDKPLVVNYDRTGQGQAAQNRNITIQGGIWNGSGHQANGAQNRNYYGAEGWNQVFQFHGVDNLTLMDCALRNGRTFLAYITNSAGVNVSGCSFFQSPSLPDVARGNEYVYIHDGLKIGGPCSGVTISGVSGYTVDDILSLCPNDGFVPTPGSTAFGWMQTYSPWANYGHVENVLIDGVDIQGSYHGMRLLTVSHHLKNITIKNVSGTAHEFALVCDNYVASNVYYSGGTGGYVDSLTLDNWNIAVTPNTNNTPTAPYSQNGFYFRTLIDQLNFTNITYAGYQAGYPMLRNEGTIGAMYGNNVTVAETTDELSTMIQGTINSKTGNLFV